MGVFLDRDGTLNVERDHLYRREDWEWIPGAVEAIRGFNRLGAGVFVVTNQAGIARGLYTCRDVDILHRHIDTLLQGEGAHIDGYYYCPHHPCYGKRKTCSCRKPEVGLLLKACREHGINAEQSFMVGDRESDAVAGSAAGMTPILVLTGYGKKEAKKMPGLAKAADVYEAYEIIKGLLKNERRL